MGSRPVVSAYQQGTGTATPAHDFHSARETNTDFFKLEDHADTVNITSAAVVPAHIEPCPGGGLSQQGNGAWLSLINWSLAFRTGTFSNWGRNVAIAATAACRRVGGSVNLGNHLRDNNATTVMVIIDMSINVATHQELYNKQKEVIRKAKQHNCNIFNVYCQGNPTKNELLDLSVGYAGWANFVKPGAGGIGDLECKEVTNANINMNHGHTVQAGERFNVAIGRIGYTSAVVMGQAQNQCVAASIFGNWHQYQNEAGRTDFRYEDGILDIASITTVITSSTILDPNPLSTAYLGLRE